MKLNARTPKAGGLCCRRVHTLVQPTFIGDPESSSCPVACGEGLAILGISDSFTGAGFYLEADASNIVELDADENIVDTIACSSGYALAYPPENLAMYADGGPNGPYYFAAGAWRIVLNFSVIGTSHINSDWEITAQISSPASIVDVYENTVIQISDDGGATWGTVTGPLTATQIDGSDVITYSTGLSQYRIRALTTAGGCEWPSAEFTFLES